MARHIGTGGDPKIAQPNINLELSELNVHSRNNTMTLDKTL